MAAAGIQMMLILIVAVGVNFWAGAVAQSNSCTNVLISMSPCLDYITGNSTKPSSSCCSQLSNVVKTQPQCLCQVVSGAGSSSLGINVNQTQAMALPSACNVQTPPVSQCTGSSPTGSPSGTTDSSSGSGSKTVPDVDTSNGNATKLTFSLLLLLIFIASSASTFSTI
ncbi:hypothetical protein ACOSP7_001487 [Xanthoceras sorbifolium]|uniref:Bifunctional inhibitor/plant lipid transfer protein/seed storage helical domain-containing protein n=1 Tax=Xanthoceras sorbifolium TaxID=99658 RepID=A0ABQ8IML5_9ROSI|nr:hypothetical protein JRO89_XS01G0268500 [Xanthoceras sorbifolium]